MGKMETIEIHDNTLVEAIPIKEGEESSGCLKCHFFPDRYAETCSDWCLSNYREDKTEVYFRKLNWWQRLCYHMARGM